MLNDPSIDSHQKTTGTDYLGGAQCMRSKRGAKLPFSNPRENSDSGMQCDETEIATKSKTLQFPERNDAPCVKMHPHASKNKSRPGRTRTRDQGIMSPLL